MPLGFSTEELATLPTTSYKFVLVTRLVVITGIVTILAFVYLLVMKRDVLAMDLLNSWFLFLGALAGINVAQYGVKRATDKDTKVAVATAKATSSPPLTVTTGDDTTVKVTQEQAAKRISGAQVQPMRSAPHDPAGQTHEWASGEPQEGLL